MVVFQIIFVDFTVYYFLSFTPPELTRDGPIGGAIVKLQNNIYIENQLVIYFLNSPNYSSSLDSSSSSYWECPSEYPSS